MILDQTQERKHLVQWIGRLPSAKPEQVAQERVEVVARILGGLLQDLHMIELGGMRGIEKFQGIGIQSTLRGQEPRRNADLKRADHVGPWNLLGAAEDDDGVASYGHLLDCPDTFEPGPVKEGLHGRPFLFQGNASAGTEAELLKLVGGPERRSAHCFQGAAMACQLSKDVDGLMAVVLGLAQPDVDLLRAFVDVAHDAHLDDPLIESIGTLIDAYGVGPQPSTLGRVSESLQSAVEGAGDVEGAAIACYRAIKVGRAPAVRNGLVVWTVVE